MVSTQALRRALCTRRCQLSKNTAREIFVDFRMSGNWLENSCLGILIPIMFAAMADEDASLLFNFLDPNPGASSYFESSMLARDDRNIARCNLSMDIEKMFFQIAEARTL